MIDQKHVWALAAVAATLLLSACQVPPPDATPLSEGHLGSGAPPPAVSTIPEPVRQTPFVPAPQPRPPSETYTVVVSDVPVKELLFALARDAGINIDVSPRIEGTVTLNAVEQTLEQILDRLARQVDLRYEMRDDTLVIEPDAPVMRTYRVDYVNVARESTAIIASSTVVGGQTGGTSEGNTSSSTINNSSNNLFWDTLEGTLEQMLLSDSAVAASVGSKRVIANREAGLLSVNATTAQHRMVQAYLSQLMASVTRQVLIEATIVEVALSDRYQAGINWQLFTRQAAAGGAGIALGTDLGDAFAAAASGGVSGLVLSGSDATANSGQRNIEASLKLLQEFGDTQVLSSPKVMTLNNQPAVLKVVDNEVYFDINIETNQNQNNTTVNTESEVRTVAVGLVMNVTPQISSADEVTLNVRPTITRVREFREDPAVPIALAQAAAVGVVIPPVSNLVPVVQVRETETVMRVSNGQTAIIGGLMQDRREADDEAVPGVSEIQGVGELFKFRDRQQTKTELVVFLRPTVIRSADIDADLTAFRSYLPENLRTFERYKNGAVATPGN